MIYFHIPFCRHACVYCDFHFNTSLRFLPDLYQALHQEIDYRKAEIPEWCESIYFGGGTPSVLSAEQIERLINHVKQISNLSPEAEITLEANPEDLSPDYLKEIHEAGINRLSIGIQSFEDEFLNFMNRKHSAQQAIDCVNSASQIGFSDISIDLIYGIPGISNNTWINAIQKAAHLPVNHLSCYALTIEPQTPLAKKINTGKANAASDEQCSEQFEILRQKASELGFIHYEVSNFQRNNSPARHNSAYWSGKPYVGIGPSAHSFNGKQRRVNIAHNRQYFEGLLKGDCPHETEQIDSITRYHEIVLTGIRTKKGINLSEINKTGEITSGHFIHALKKHRTKFSISEKFAALNEDYWIVAENIALDFFIAK